MPRLELLSCCFVLLALFGCSDSPPAKDASASPSDTKQQAAVEEETSEPSPAAATPGEKSKSIASPDKTAPPPTKPDKPAPAAEPATPAAARKVIDLETFPLVKGAKENPSLSLARVSYRAEGDVAASFKFIKDKLLAEKWKELPGGYESEQSTNGTFERENYRLSVSVYQSGEPNEVDVNIINHGNLAANSLPRPKELKPLYDFPVSAAYLSEASVEEAAAETKKLFTDAGWEPYGTAGDTHNFKKNAIEAAVTVAAAPAQEGKTVLTYATRLLSHDLPVPGEATQIQYSDRPAQLSFDLAGTYDEVDAFYREQLGKQGWEATTEKPIEIGRKHIVIFRNPQKDFLEVQLTTVEDKSRVLLKYMTAAEFDAQEKALDEALAKKKETENKPKPKLALALPADVKELEAKAGNIEFKLAAGEAKAAVEKLQKQLINAGWKAEEAKLDDMFGVVILSKGEQTITINYVETGILPAEVSITALGVELEAKK